MAQTLLDLLEEAGQITREQFDEALKNRVLYGGKIGTSLLEMGLIDENELARFLSRQLSVPYVASQQLMNIPAETIRMLPQELALKYAAVPLSLDKKRLNLVMADPNDLKAIDEIAFITGYIITPMVSPEIRLMQALNQYYNKPIDSRYQQIIDKMSQHQPRNTQAENLTKEKPASSPSGELRAINGKPSAATASPSGPADKPTQTPQPRASERRGPARQPATLGEKLAALQQKKAIVPPQQPLTPSPSKVPPGPAPKAAPAPPTVLTGLANAGDREDIANALMSFLGKEFRKTALFVVRGNSVSGWKAVTQGVAREHFNTVSIPLTRPSALKTVAEGRSFFLGTIPRTPLDDRWIQGVGGQASDRVLLMPLMIGGRVVCILYVEEGDRNLSSHIGKIQRLLAKAAMAFEILILREKILMM